MKITFNAPVTLLFSLLCAIIYFVYSGDNPRLAVLHADFQLTNWKWYVSIFGYTVGHGSIDHLIGNLSMILLLGPILEEKYGSLKFLSMLAITAVSTALVHIIFFSTGLIGASGLVFMMIVLISLTNMKKGQIPVTFILIVMLYIGQEVYKSFSSDQVSQFAHIFGGIMGAILGFTFNSGGKTGSLEVGVKSKLV